MSLEQRKASPDEQRDVDLWSEAVHEALQGALGPSSGAGHGPQVVRGIVGAPGPWAPVEEFVRQANVLDKPPAERLAVYRTLAYLLVKRCRTVAARADIPLTPKLVAQNAQHIAGIFDNAFPGYLRAGLINVVVRRVCGVKG